MRHLMFLLAATPVLAETSDFDFARLIDVEAVDLFPPEGDEMALLLRSADPGYADLIVLGSTEEGDPPKTLAFVPAIVGAGATYGTMPSLDLTPDGRLLIRSEWSVSGNPWFQVLGVGGDGDQLMLTGYSFDTYVRPTGSYMGCSVDLWEGDYGLIVGLYDPESGDLDEWLEDGILAPAPLPLAEWAKTQAVPPICDRAFERFWAD